MPKTRSRPRLCRRFVRRLWFVPGPTRASSSASAIERRERRPDNRPVVDARSGGRLARLQNELTLRAAVPIVDTFRNDLHERQSGRIYPVLEPGIEILGPVLCELP